MPSISKAEQRALLKSELAQIMRDETAVPMPNPLAYLLGQIISQLDDSTADRIVTKLLTLADRLKGNDPTG